MNNWKQNIRSKVEPALLFLLGPYAKSLTEGLKPQSGWKNFWRQSFDTYIATWVWRGFLSTIVAGVIYWCFGNPYAYESMQEGLAPKLWNTVAMVGMIFSMIGVILKIISGKLPSISFKSSIYKAAEYFDHSSSALLKFASEIGAFGFGIVFAFFIIFAVNSELYIANIIRFMGGAFLIGMVFIFNLVVWWLALVVLNKTERPPLLEYWQQKSSIFRFTFATIGFLFFSSVTMMVN